MPSRSPAILFSVLLAAGAFSAAEAPSAIVSLPAITPCTSGCACSIDSIFV